MTLLLGKETLHDLSFNPSSRDFEISTTTSGFAPDTPRHAVIALRAYIYATSKFFVLLSQVNIPNADLAEVGLELAGKGGGASDGGDDHAPSPAVDVSVVTVNSNQNTILFADTAFLASQARGEVFGGENSF